MYKLGKEFCEARENASLVSTLNILLGFVVTRQSVIDAEKTIMWQLVMLAYNGIDMSLLVQLKYQ